MGSEMMMSTNVNIILALLPITVIFALLAFRHVPADIAGLIGWLLTIILVWLVFDTSINVILLSSLGGFVASLPIALVVATSIFQLSIMQETGAISRIIAFIKTVSPTDRIVQIMIVNIGFGTILTALGAVPVSILPPIMLSLGYSSYVAIALPAIGYDALTTYALLGVPVVVFSNIVGISVREAGMFFAPFMPVISTCIALGMLRIVGGWKMLINGFIPAVLSGITAGIICIGMSNLGLVTITGIAAGIGVIVIMVIYLFLRRKPIQDRSKMDEADKSAVRRMPLFVAFSPWIILIISSLLVNTQLLPFFDITFHRLSMPIEIIPNSPEKVRFFWQAYFWIAISTLISLPIMKTSSSQLKVGFHKWLKRAPRPVFSAVIFFAIAFLYIQSGKDASWQIVDKNLNIIALLSNAATETFDRFYPFIAPYLGLLAGFISGSETSSIVMLTNLHLTTAKEIGAVGLVIAAASGIGGGLASVISPAKLQNAAASIDRIGEESQVIRTTVIISLVITTVCALMSYFWAY